MKARLETLLVWLFGAALICMALAVFGAVIYGAAYLIGEGLGLR